MGIYVYFVFNGQTKEALALYKEAFQTDEAIVKRFNEIEGYEKFVPEGYGSHIMHAEVDILGTKVMFSDSLPGQEHHVGNHITVAVVTDNEQQLQFAFDVLARDGEIIMHLQATDWSKSYGSLRDRFGVEWQFNLEG